MQLVRLRSRYLVLASLLLALSCATSQEQKAPAPQQKEDIAPERGTGVREGELARAQRFVVASAHPDATHAGVEVLRQGGTALAAAVAIQMTVTLGEPQSS